MEIIKGILSVIQIIAAVGMVTVIVLQTTKSEGLSGTIGGKATSTFHGKPGTEEKLNLYTKYTAITFMVASALVFYISPR